MEDFEKLGVFYLGKSYDLAAKEARDELLLYDSKDLVTHAVCVGMTGSGKTDGADIEWTAAGDLTPEDLETVPEEGAAFLALPARAADPKSYARWEKDFTTWLHRTQTLELLKSPTHKLLSQPGESEGDFRLRLAQTGRELRDQKTEQLRSRFTPKLAALEDSIRQAQQVVERETEQSRRAHVQTAISLGATLLGAFVGRKSLNRSTVGRATTAVRGVGRSVDQAGDIGRAKQDVEALLQQRLELEAAFKAEVDALETKLDPATEPLETRTLRPKKSDITEQPVALCWTPQRVPPTG